MHTIMKLAYTAASLALLSTTASAQLVSEPYRVTAFDGVNSDFFGFSTNANNGVLAIGAYGDDDNGVGSGSVYLYNTNTGELITKVAPGFTNSADSLGYCVAVHDHTIVGVPNSGDHRHGSALVLDNETGAVLQVLRGADISNPDYIWRFSQFGRSVAANKGVVAVGATECCDDANIDYRGGVWVFAFDDETNRYEHTALIRPNDIAFNDKFGYRVDISGQYLIGGSPSDRDFGNTSGSAYIFDHTAGHPGYGLQLHKLNADDAGPNDRFGSSVAIDKNIAVVGARADSENEQFSGSVYIFDTQTGEQIAKLTSPNPTFRGLFGISVAMVKSPTFPSIFIVGAPGDDYGLGKTGAAYIYDRYGNLIKEIRAFDAQPDDGFGISVSISDGNISVGSHRADTNGTDSGAAYFFPKCRADFNDSWTLEIDDVFRYMSLYNAEQPQADFNQDGSLNALDVMAYCAAYLSGCE